MQVSGFTFHLHWQPGVVNSALCGAERLLPSDGGDPIRQPTAALQRSGFWDRPLHWRSKLRRALGLQLVKRSSAVFFFGGDQHVWHRYGSRLWLAMTLRNLASQSCLISPSPPVPNTNMWLKAKKTSILPLHLWLARTLQGTLEHRHGEVESFSFFFVAMNRPSSWMQTLLVDPPDTFPRERVLWLSPWTSVVQS